MKRSLANMVAVLEDLHAGIPVIKISRNGDHHRRYLTLSQDQCTLCLTHSKVDNETHPSRLPQPFWTPSKGLKGHYFRYLDVADIIDAQMGVSGGDANFGDGRQTEQTRGLERSNGDYFSLRTISGETTFKSIGGKSATPHGSRRCTGYNEGTVRGSISLDWLRSFIIAVLVVRSGYGSNHGHFGT